LPYNDLGGDYFIRRNKTAHTRRLLKSLKNLGYSVQLTPIAAWKIKHSFFLGINAMQSVRASTLIPRGFVADEAVNDVDGALITMRPASSTSLCPACGAISGRIHSRYSRRLADLPIVGRRVRLVLLAWRFRCGAVLCGRRIFNERFDADVLAPWARRTARLDHIVHHLALALGGRPAASFARPLMLPVSNDTLLRLVRRRGTPHFDAPTVVGIDDWAWRRNQR
jgi:zinc-finger of transposase IS204/IS1001/IS1096/IS1165